MKKPRFAILISLSLFFCAAVPLFAAAATSAPGSSSACESILLYTKYLYENDPDTYEAYGSGHIQTLGLSEADAQRYPQLARALDDFSDDSTERLTAQFEEYCADARTERSESGRAWQADVETDIQVRRMDDTVCSFLVSYASYSGGVHGYYSYTGYNYRTDTGTPILLSDVIRDEETFRRTVCEKLQAQYGAYLEEGLEERLAEYTFNESDHSNPDSEDNRGDDGSAYEFNWIMDQTGIHVMFNPYEIAPYASGAQHVHLGFAQYPELFTDAFHAQLGAWVFQPNTWLDDLIDLTGDGAYQRFMITEETDDYDTIKSLTVQVGASQVTAADLYCYDTTPLIMHTANGRSYLYVDAVTDNDYHMLTVFDLTGSTVRWLGNEYGGFGMLYDNIRQASLFTLPLTPAHFCINDRIQFLSTFTGQRYYRVSKNGMPAPVGTAWYTAWPTSMVTLRVIREIPVTLIDAECMDQDPEQMTGKEGYLHPGEFVSIWRSDAESMIDVKRTDGSAARIYIDATGWPRTINGEDENSYFERLYYAG